MQNFIEWKRKMNESTLSRVWSMANDKDRVFAILTAFRGNLHPDQNKARNQKLKSSIRKQGYGFFDMEGYWVENEGTENEERVKEESFFVSAPKDSVDVEEFRKWCVDQLKKYDQDAAVIKLDDGKVALIDKNDKIFADIGKFNVNRVATMYSKLRNGRTFVFEAASAPDTFSVKMLERFLNEKENSTD